MLGGKVPRSLSRSLVTVSRVDLRWEGVEALRH